MTIQDRQARDRQAFLEKRKVEAQRLAEELPDLDFSDLRQLLVWLRRVCDSVDHDQVVAAFPWDVAAEAFESHGFVAVSSIDVAVYNAGPNQSARAIIGFGLDGMKGNNHTYSRIAPYLVGYVEHWLDLFPCDQPELLDQPAT